MAVVGLAYFTYLMFLISWQYVPPQKGVAFLSLKYDVEDRLYYRLAFFVHVYASFWLLILGAMQFSSWLRKRFSKWHKNAGKLYVGIIVFLAGPSGLVMAVHAEGGTSAKIGFSLLAILWIAFTYLAFKHALRKKWQRHQAFMIRSFALTLSAISLRLFKLGIVHLFEPGPADVYRIVAWMGWLVNLGIAEWIIYRLRKTKYLRT